MLFNKKVEIGDIKSLEFSYSNGYAMNAYTTYKIECNEKCVVEVKPHGVPDEDKLKIEIDKKVCDKLKDILEKYNVGKWDGFNKNDKNVLDGDSFHLYVHFVDGTGISASGYMKWPNHYGEVKGELDGFFTNLIKDKTINWNFINLDEETWIELNKKYNISYYEDTLEVKGKEYELVIDGNIINGLDNDKFVIDILDSRDDSVKVKISRKEKSND